MLTILTVISLHVCNDIPKYRKCLIFLSISVFEFFGRHPWFGTVLVPNTYIRRLFECNSLGMEIFRASSSEIVLLFFQGVAQNQNRIRMYCFFRALHKNRIDSECIVVFYRASFRNRFESEYILVFYRASYRIRIESAL